MIARSVVVALAVATLGCTGARLPMPALAPTRLNLAVASLEHGQHAAAIADLVKLAGACPATPVRRYALLLAAAASIDPRNPSRGLNEGAALAARYLAVVPSDEAGGRPLAEALYLLALELGAERPPATEACGEGSAEAATVALALPMTGAPTVSQRIRGLERELASLRDELARIRKTLEP